MICSCTLYGKSKELTVLQMNIWQEGTMVDGGFDAIADEVSRLSPDIVLFSEVRNYHGKQFIPRILQALKDRGVNYYGETSTLDVGILSKYKIQEQRPNYPLKNDAGSVLKARIEIEGHLPADPWRYNPVQTYTAGSHAASPRCVPVRK